MGQALEAAKRQYELVHAGNIEALADLYSEGCEVVAMGVTVHGRDQLKGFTAGMLGAFPDLNHEISQVIEQGSSVLAVVEITGTHLGTLRGPGGDLQASGRKFRVPAAQVFQVEDGRIKRMQSFADRLDVLQQLGAMPAPSRA